MLNLVSSHFFPYPLVLYAVTELSCVIAIVTRLCAYVNHWTICPTKFWNCPSKYNVWVSMHLRENWFFFWTCFEGSGPGALVTQIELNKSFLLCYLLFYYNKKYFTLTYTFERFFSLYRIFEGIGKMDY